MKQKLRFRNLVTIYIVSVLVLLVPVSTVHAQTPGFGIIGDSATDEYRADDNRGGVYAATTFNWVELLVRKRGLNFGPWGTRSEPRRSGYEYNWARSGATSGSMISQGQLTGISQQVRDGKVEYVVIFIGSNDFATNNIYAQIYAGTVSGAQLSQFLNQIVANISQAVDTIKAAGTDRIILTNIADITLAKQAPLQLPEAVGRARLSNAYTTLNQSLTQMAAAKGVTLFDYNSIILYYNSITNSNNFMIFGGELIDMVNKGNEPHHALLGDDYTHSGTVLSGILANRLFISTANAAWGLAIPQFTTTEILQNAGINAGPVPSPTSTPCSLDFDGNGKLNVLDAVRYLSSTTLSELLLILTNWNRAC